MATGLMVKAETGLPFGEVGMSMLPMSCLRAWMGSGVFIVLVGFVRFRRGAAYMMG